MPAGVLASFEFIKMKYSVSHEQPHEWLIAAIPLSLVLFLFGYLGFVVFMSFSCHGSDIVLPCLRYFFEKHRSFSLGLVAAIAGAYTYMLRAFYQAVNNFDLTPSSFFGAANNLVFGVALTQIATFYLSETIQGPSFGTALLVVTAFIGGYMPDNILRYLLGTSFVKKFKEERSDFGKAAQAVPIEVLDGIDSFVRYRLSDFHITSVQNLATINPIMLFVETPYTFYETLDWVCQAQLCCSVGPDAMFKLWELGIRTIFDLERVVTADPTPDVKLCGEIQRIILPNVASDPSAPMAALIADVKMRVDAPHTRRLRLIVDSVNLKMASDTRRPTPSNATLP